MIAPTLSAAQPVRTIEEIVEDAGDLHPWPTPEDMADDAKKLASINRATANDAQAIAGRELAGNLYRYCAMSYARSFLSQAEPAATIAKSSIQLCHSDQFRFFEWIVASGVKPASAEKFIETANAMLSDEIVAQVLIKRSEKQH
ncbi:hypothetical protein [Sphingobium sp. LSP13-1-1.1]|uniref:hypothetical protein n=1 Tax=Sphingobium sp. LSP13-1-1.1 TaxID=3135234 RepID=UPI00342AFB06